MSVARYADGGAAGQIRWHAKRGYPGNYAAKQAKKHRLAVHLQKKTGFGSYCAARLRIR